MGYMRHHAIIVTDYDVDRLMAAHGVAADIFPWVSQISPRAMNGSQSFFIPPDGSKEGWTESNHGDVCRARFIAWLDSHRHEDGSSSVDWAEVQYGDGDKDSRVTAASDWPAGAKSGTACLCCEECPECTCHLSLDERIGPEDVVQANLESRVADWIRTRIGQDHMQSKERAMRLIEEAVELAQAEGITVEQVGKQVVHVYNRPAGEPAQEAAGVAVCLLGWCAATGNRLDALALAEIERIEAKPIDQIRGSLARKADADLVTTVWTPAVGDRVTADSWGNHSEVIKEFLTEVAGHERIATFAAGGFWRVSQLRRVIDCPCWATGKYVWVEGCDGHPRESMV